MKRLMLGEIAHTTNFGSYELIELNGNRCTVRFLNTGYTTEIRSTEFRRGQVKDWTNSMKNKVGELFDTINYGPVQILEYFNTEKVMVKFLNTGTVDCFPAFNIKAGRIQDYNLPMVCGVGFMGVGDYNSANAKKQYKHWCPMIRRCYDTDPEFINYFDKSVDKDWHNFQNFAEWCLDQKGFNMKSWQLDKDIIKRGNKEYGPDVCAFIPPRVNSLLIKPPKGFWDKWNKFNISLRSYEGVKKCGRFDSEQEGYDWYNKEKSYVIDMICKDYQGQVDDRVLESIKSWDFFLKTD